MATTHLKIWDSDNTIKVGGLTAKGAFCNNLG